MQQGEQLATELIGAERQFNDVQAELDRRQLDIPNLPHESVPVGTD
jgi:seryl-tRNA synthetase